MVKVCMKKASGGEVCYLESSLQMRFPPRSSGKNTFALGFKFTKGCFLRPVYQTQLKKIDKKFGSRQGQDCLRWQDESP